MQQINYETGETWDDGLPDQNQPQGQLQEPPGSQPPDEYMNNNPLPEPPPERRVLITNMKNGVRQNDVTSRDMTPEDIAKYDKAEPPMRTGVQDNGTPWASNDPNFVPPAGKPDLTAGMPKLYNQQKTKDDSPTIPGAPPGEPGWDTTRSKFERFARKQITDTLGEDPITMSVSQFKAKAWSEMNQAADEAQKTNLIVSPNTSGYNQRVNEFIARKREGLQQLDYMMNQFDKDHELKTMKPGEALTDSAGKIITRNPVEPVPKTPNEIELTQRALKGDKEAQAVLDTMQKRKEDAAAATQTKKDAGLDVPGLAKAVADGQDAPVAIKGSMGNPLAAKVKSEVLKGYPKFSFEMADANYKWKQSATNQRTVNFAGGALPRLGALDDQLNKLPNGDVNAINKVMSAVSKQFGKPEYTNYESNRNAIVQEIGTALSGTSQASDLRIKIELENLESAKSPAQIRGSISNLREALIARLDVDLSPLYPIEVVRGEKTIDQFKKDQFAKFRGKYGKYGEGEAAKSTALASGSNFDRLKGQNPNKSDTEIKAYMKYKGLN